MLSWIVTSIGAPLILGGLKLAAKKTDWVWDDKAVTLLAGLWDIYRGKSPRNFTKNLRGAISPKIIERLAETDLEVKRYCRGGDTLE